MLLSSHPRPVREAIERHRRELDRDPVGHLQAENDPRQTRVLRAASDYLGASPGDIALTDSTTMGLGLVYTGLELRPGDEVLATEHDYYSTHESLRLAAERTGAAVRLPPGPPTAAASLPAASSPSSISGRWRRPSICTRRSASAASRGAPTS